MSQQLASIFVLSALLARPVYALPTRRRRTSSRGGIIAGCIVAGLVLLLFISVCLMMARRRRARKSTPTGPGGGGPTQHDPKPMFGGLWGRSNVGYNGKHAAGQGTNNYNANGAQPQSQTPYYPDYYPGQNGAAPPPTYGQDAGYGREFAAPSGPPQVQSDNQGAYAAPQGPPPAAHTAGKDNQFVGGFRS
ncbi:hypothetical protein BJ912DRAFT_958452 [Pholiota molesta]|nr:hypothetical protein BJ912DRAFT_958452 [Pholiota molesta]